MNKFLTCFLFVVISMTATAQKISDLPATNSVNPSGLLNVAVPLGGTNSNRKVRVDDLRGGAYVSVRDFGALGGTNDDTASFSNAISFCATNRRVLTMERTNYTTGPLLLTNNVHIDGNGASISLLDSGLTLFTAGDAIDAWQITNWSLVNLKLYGSTNQTTPTIGNRIGVKLITQNANARVENVVCIGFNSDGFQIHGINSLADYQSNNVRIVNCAAYSCYYGYRTVFSAEYTGLDYCRANNCAEGASIGSGNFHIMGGDYSGNVVGIRINAGNNAAHNGVTGATINHCTFPVICADFTAGHRFSNCEIMGSGTVILTNCGGVVFEGGVYAPTSGTIVYGGTSAGMNHVIGCGYFSTEPALTINSGGLFNRAMTHNISSTTNAWYRMDGIFGVTNITPDGGKLKIDGTIKATNINDSGVGDILTLRGETRIGQPGQNAWLDFYDDTDPSGYWQIWRSSSKLFFRDVGGSKSIVIEGSKLYPNSDWRGLSPSIGFFCGTMIDPFTFTGTNSYFVGPTGFGGSGTIFTNGFGFPLGLTITNGLQASGTLAFANLAANSSTNMTLACSGAAAGDLVIPGIPPTVFTASASNVVFTMWPSQNVVFVKAVNAGPAATFNSATFKAAVIKIQ